MKDWIYDNIPILFLVTFVGGMVVVLYFVCQNEGRLLRQCMADGHKEYECVALMRERSQIVTPVLIR